MILQMIGHPDAVRVALVTSLAQLQVMSGGTLLAAMTC